MKARITLLFLAVAVTLPLAAQETAAQHYFTDTELVDQSGVRHRFYTDLLKDKVVVINAFFTSCHDSCPVMAERLAKIQDWLGERLNLEVNLLSISVDPTADTPRHLKEFADKFHARSGWYLLSGSKENVDLVLRKLGQYVEEKNTHLTVFLIGNDRTGLWKKVIGTASSEELIKALEPVLNDRTPTDTKSR